MQRVRRGIAYLRKHMPKYIEKALDHDLYFVTDGQDMFVLVNGRDVISLVKNPGQRIFGVMIYDFRKMIEETRDAVYIAA